ncbi:MAG: translation initiation factor IF-2 [Bacilli bacterium]|nr:translation initiation factor IF-2 [Bacilli bacterium]
MMTVFEYAEDVNKNVEEILKKCKELGFKVTDKNSLLSQDDITELDSSLEDTEEELDNIVEKIIEKKEINLDNVVKKEKLKKKSDFLSKKTQKEIATQRKEMYKHKEKLMTNASIDDGNIVLYTDNMAIAELASRLGVTSSELIKKLFNLGVLANLNTSISFENAEILVLDYNKELKKEAAVDITNFEEYEVNDADKDLTVRPPVVTIMGHVDHGKTTLLDYIRKSKVADYEAGGITQAISAYQVDVKGNKITFIDTPGHAAFTEMRARGASITDIIIIIVAADDGVMPQTKEVIDHAKAANVPIIVAINKIDVNGADADKVMHELSEYGLLPDTWGGDTIYNKISAKTGEGVDELLDNILLISEMQDYKANANRYAIGTVVESRLDKHLGPIVTALVQNGTLRMGDPIVVGTSYGKVRTLKNDLGKEIMEALPSMPIEITGLGEIPVAGDKFMAFESEKQAKSVAEQRKEKAKEAENKGKNTISLDDLFSKIKEGNKEVNVIIKADVHGSAEAVKNSLENMNIENVKVKVVRSSVGNISESDVVLAKATNSILIGFNVRPTSTVKDHAKDNGIEIRLYNIIYKVVEDMEAAMKGMLEPTYEEKVLGEASVRQLFKFSKVGTIAGSYITDGIVKKDAKARIIRDGVVIYDGSISSLQREKDAVKEVKKGLECGITIENYNDLKENDIIECYEIVEVKK